MTPAWILACVAAYFSVLLAIAWRTSRGADSSAYYLGNTSSPWYAVAFGFIGDSLSGVTFISVPGQVAQSKFSYFQVILGNLVGYAVIAAVLLPLYYRLNLTSIYSYLGTRFGRRAQKTGSFFFLISRTTGAAARLFLAVNVLQTFVFDAWKIPFPITVLISILLILAYTVRGGIKTLVWTDTFQSTFLLLGVGLSMVAIMRHLHLDIAGMIRTVRASPMSEAFFWDWKAPNFFWKHFTSGVCLAIVMNGLDQNMMQKNLSCRSLREAQWNIYSFSLVMVLVNLLFLSLGVLLYEFATRQGIPIPARPDGLFPNLAMNHLGFFASLVFIVGLTAATFSSADSVLTSLTTSFCVDFLKLDLTGGDEASNTRTRHWVHGLFAVILLVVILAFRALNSDAVVNAILKLAGYTYGPLLGLFALGLTTERRAPDAAIPWVCCLSPLLCWVLEQNSAAWLGGYRFGFELLLVNAALTAGTLAAIGALQTPSRTAPGRAPRPR